MRGLNNIKRMKQAAGVLFGLSIMGLFSGCATQVRLNMLLPADYHEASLTKTVAVLPFGGPDGAAIALHYMDSEFRVNRLRIHEEAQGRPSGDMPT